MRILYVFLCCLLLTLIPPGKSDTYVHLQDVKFKDVDYAGSVGGKYGTSVAVSTNGNIVAVGAWGYSGVTSGEGSVYVYESDGDLIDPMYSLSQTLAGGTNEKYGYTVAMNGNGSTLVVEARGYNTNVGAIRIYQRAAGDSSWVLLITYDGAGDGRGSGNDWFGSSLAVCDACYLIAIGCPLWDNTYVNMGMVLVYDMDTQGAHPLMASNGLSSDLFGSSVAMDDRGEMVLVGAYMHDDTEFSLAQTGAIYVFKYNGLSYVEVEILKARVPTLQQEIGHSLAGSFDLQYFVAGSREGAAGGTGGGAHVFARADRSSNYTYNMTLVPSELAGNSDQFGYSVDMTFDGRTIVVGAGKMISDNGAVWIYLRDDSRASLFYENTGFVQSVRAYTDEQFGWSVAVSGNGQVMVSGSPSYSSGALNAGAMDIMLWNSTYKGPNVCNMDPCLNDGNCTSINLDQFPTSLNRGYTEEVCNCNNTGFEGSICDVNINECLTAPCGANGACNDEINSFTCTCEDNYSGELCDCFDVCSLWPCLNSGTCYPVANSCDDFTCFCFSGAGYHGALCDVDIDDCESNPCENGGVCVDAGPNLYDCTCPEGVIGENCETNVDDCVRNQCVHGWCVDDLLSYNCSCELGWSGSLCDVEIDECLSAPCDASSLCVDGNGTYTCVFVAPPTSSYEVHNSSNSSSSSSSSSMFSLGNISSSSSVATSALSSTAMTSSMTDIGMSSSSSGVNSTNSSSSSSSSKTGAELTFLAGLPSAAEYEDIAVECPTIFYIDSDNECQHCPSGGVCPADARGQVFAIEGYWQKDTFAAPIRCPMGATACAGTDVDAVYKGDVVAAAGCNEGYEGYACADCAEDYSKNFLACEVCPVGTLGVLDIVLRFLSPIICLVLLMFASAFAHPKYVISTASTIVLLQRIVVMGQQASMELGSPALAAFFSYCSVINWDMSVTRPDCNVAAFTAITYFWSSCILILAAHISCHFMIAVRVYILKPPQDPLQKAAVYKLRASVASASITIMTYMRIIQVIAQGIVCVEDSESGVSRLAVDPNVVCYTGAHMVAVGVMYLILIVLGLCFPVFLYKSARAYSQLKIANAGLDTRMANRIGTLDEPKHVFDVWLTYYKKDGLWFLFVVYAGSFCIALQGALASSASVRTFIVGSIIVGDSIVAILMKPYTIKLLYIRKVLLCTTAVVMQASFIVVLAFSNIHTGTQTQNLVLASLVCVLLIGYLAYSFWAIQIKQDLMGTPVDTDRIVVKIKQKEDFELPA